MVVNVTPDLEHTMRIREELELPVGSNSSGVNISPADLVHYRNELRLPPGSNHRDSLALILDEEARKRMKKMMYDQFKNIAFYSFYRVSQASGEKVHTVKIGGKYNGQQDDLYCAVSFLTKAVPFFATNPTEALSLV